MVNGRYDGNTYLARLVESRDMTIDGLAQRLRERSDDGTQPDSSLVWKWLHARVRPGKYYRGLLASVLEVDENLLRDEVDRDYRLRTRTAADRIEDSAPTDVTYEVQFPPGDLVDRRVVVQALLMSAGAGAMVDLYDSVNRNTMSSASAEGLAIATEHLGRNFDRYDLVELQGQLDFHMSFVGKHLRESLTVGQRSMLVHHGARLAGMAASVAFLTGNVHGAIVFDDISFQLAREVADEGIMAWLLCEEAGMATYAGDPRRALQLLERAANTSDRAQRANATTNLARAFGQLGDQSEVSRVVSEAERLLPSITNDQDSSISGPHWSFSQVSGYTRIAESWLEMDMHRDASIAAQQALDLASAGSSSRLVAHARLILCAAEAGLGNVEAAVQGASEVFAEAPQDFYTVAAHARPLFRQLSHLQNSSAAAQLRAEYDHYTHNAAV